MSKRYSLIQFTISKLHNIGIISLYNVSKKNALSFKMLEELNSCFKALQTEDCKVIVLESKCENIFSSGHNLKEINDNPDKVGDIIQICSDLMLNIMKSEKVVIAEVDGLVTAAGFQLAASCDLIVASDRSKFAIPGSNIGLYASTPAIPLILNLPNKIAFDILIGGRVYSASDMLNYGIINRVVKNQNNSNTKEKLRHETETLAISILKQEGALANIKDIKKTLYKL